MKTIILLFCTLLYVDKVRTIGTFYRGHTVRYDIPPPGDLETTSERVSTNYFLQKLDHYDLTNTVTWSQRYYVNDEFFNTKKRNVVFLMIGGEGEASIRWLTSGAWIETAKMYEALLFQVEHRFYGDSHPFEDLSTENLRYLTTPQALGDLSTFITAMNEQYELASDVKWIAFGGSYSASLAAWLRQKYPHLVQGAMAASGPLYAKLDFVEYFQVVADDLAAYSQECVSVVKTAINQLEGLLKNPNTENVTSLFNLCDAVEEHVNNTSDMSNLFETFADIFAGIAQYNKNYGRTTSLDDLCDILTDKTIGSEIYRLAEVTKFMYGSSCVDYKYESTLDYMKNIAIRTSGNMRQWIYQTCTEYGWYQTSSQDSHVFGDRFPIDHFTKLCTDVYGEEFNATYISEQNEQININFGGYNIDVSNVVHVHGSFDPWHPMGLIKTTNPNSPVIFINGTAHCANMYDISKDDLPQLTEARKDINKLIGDWLNIPSGVTSQASLSLLCIIFMSMTSLTYYNMF